MPSHNVPNNWTCLRFTSAIMVFVLTLLVLFTNFATIASFTGLHSLLNKHNRKAIADLQVDLRYETYVGVANSSTGLNVYKGFVNITMIIDLTSDGKRMRFAAPPTGSLRWQAPQPPTTNRGTVIDASSFGAACPHNLKAGQYTRVLPSPISEDCLFLNVWAPHNASGLPVFVNIHGGGYGVGDSREDLSKLINANDNAFVGVSVQYRVSTPNSIFSGALLLILQ
jgi:acetyl esterase/lipase